MALSSELISKFVKATKDEPKTNKETVVYGVVTQIHPDVRVKLLTDDAPDTLAVYGESIPVASQTTVVEVNDKVECVIKNHKLSITGTSEYPAARRDSTAHQSDIDAATGRIENLESSTARIDDLVAANATIQGKLDAHDAEIDNLKAADVEITGRLTANEADIEYLKALDIDVETLNAAKAFVEDLKASDADIDYLVSTVAEIDTLIFGSATGNVIQTSFSNAVIAQLGDAQIKSAMIESVSAGKITAGDIITNNVRVKSEDGSLIISDETLQISDENRVRVQIGKDASDDYSINIWDQNGNLMFSKGGITDAAIKEAIIRNDMVSDTANIHASKLDIDSLFEEINDSSNTIKSTKVYLDEEGQTLDVAFKSLTTEVTEQGETISSQGTDISTIQGQISSKIWQQDINTAKNEMSTQYSTLEQEVDSFKTTVSETYATHATLSTIDAKASNAITTANNAQYDIDSLEIGGRNLYLNTTDEEVTVTFTGWQHDLEMQTHSSVRVLGGKTVTISGYINNISGDENVGLTLYVATPDFTSGYKQYHNHYTAIPPGESGRVVNTFNLNDVNEITSMQIRLRHYKSDTSTNTVSYHSIKLEVGNKVTDWTPAPEDVKSDIAAAQQAADNAQTDVNNLAVRVTTAETNVSQNTEAINLRATKNEVSTAKAEAISTARDDATEKANNALASANANTNTLLANYSTTSEMNAAIELTAESITSTVTALNHKVDNIEIGGRNLYCNTSDNFKTVTFSGWQSNLPDQTRDIIKTIRGRTVTISGYIENISGDEKVGLSLHIATPDNAIGYHQCHNESTAIPPGESGRVVNTFILPENFEVTSVRILLRHYTENAGESTVKYHSIKMEFGDYATDWTPAPEDIDNKITNLDAQILSAESSITQLSNSITSNVTEITNLGTRTTTLEQTSSSLTSRITIAEKDILDSAKTATNYLNFSSSGLVVGDMTASTLGKNVLIDSDSVDIRNGTTTLASFGASTIYLGKNNDKSVINLCNGSATMTAVDDTDFRIYSDKRLVMSAYQSMLLDCRRDATHMTRIAIQSSDPDQSSVVGGVQFTIYQDDIQNTVQMLGNDIILKVTDGTDTSRLTIQEDALKLYSSGRLYLNSTSTLQIGESSSYSYGVILGNTYNKAKSIGCYWNDGEAHDLITHAANGQNSFFGPSDISITDSSSLTSTTNIRGKYIRLYNHSGGGVYLGSSGSTAVTSDRNLKKDILDIDDKYLDFFDRLRPITYKYDCPENNGHRDHVGFIAQEVEEALTASGLTTEQFAGLVIERDVTLNPNYDSSLSDEENAANETHYDTLYSLRYEEFISLLVKKVQSLQEQIDQLRADK